MGARTRDRAGRRPAPLAAVLAAAVAALVVGVLTVALVIHSGGRDHTSPSASQATVAKTVATVTTIGEVSGGPLGETRRQQTKRQVTAVVDDFLDHAYLGSFPRTDFTAAFADFTPRAAVLAGKQLDVLTNRAVSDHITAATATKRRIRLSVLAPQGRPRGSTVRFVLDDTTRGDLEVDQRVRGQLYLTKPKGEPWQVFGFRIDQPVTR